MAAKQFYDDTPIETSDVQRWEDAADEVVYVEKRSKQYAKNYTDEQLSLHATDENAHMDIRSDIDGGISAHNKSADAHENRFSIIQSQVNEKAPVEYVNEAFNSHNADTDAHGGIRNTIALLQKYPCYEYNTTGGNVQRFDDVSVIPHNIGITVHGATDENGNSVVNPTLSVYGKNLCPVAGWTNKNVYSLNAPVIAGVKYTLSITIAKIYSGTTTGFKLFIGNASGTLITSVYSKPTGRYSVTFTPSASGMLYYSGFSFIDAENIQLEVGNTATEYEPYKEPQTVTVPMTFPEGNVCEIGVLNAVSPTMTIVASDDNGLISTADVTYNRDIGKALGNLQAAIAALA